MVLVEVPLPRHERIGRYEREPAAASPEPLDPSDAADAPHAAHAAGVDHERMERRELERHRAERTEMRRDLGQRRVGIDADREAGGLRVARDGERRDRRSGCRADHVATT